MMTYDDYSFPETADNFDCAICEYLEKRQPIIEYYDAGQDEYAEALRAAAWSYLWKAACADKDYDSVAQAQKMLEEWGIPVVNNH